MGAMGLHSWSLLVKIRLRMKWVMKRIVMENINPYLKIL